ncbi:MAG: hypothetical protein QG635_657 [Bacteroidota bacterium]|nr:hypothetical protein [Bacteroidota bacterium]
MKMKMKIFSLDSNVFCHFHYVICIFFMTLMTGCYSFTGSSLPGHLKTLYIANISDNSGFGNPQYKDFLLNQLFEKFRSDGSLTIVEYGGDSRLTVTITRIEERTATVGAAGQTGELETERKITVYCDAEFYDGIKKISVWKKPFSNFEIYNITRMQAGRDEAIQNALKNTADDILMAVVSGW